MQQNAIVVDLRQFKHDPKHGVARRVAELLAWAAEHSPGRMLGYQEMAQLVGVPEPRKIGRHLARARALLLRHHGRGLLASRGGARATTNPREMVGAPFLADLRRARRCIAWLRDTAVAARGTVRGDEDLRDTLKAFEKHITHASNGLSHLVLELESTGADITASI